MDVVVLCSWQRLNTKSGSFHMQQPPAGLKDNDGRFTAAGFRIDWIVALVLLIWQAYASTAENVHVNIRLGSHPLWQVAGKHWCMRHVKLTTALRRKLRHP